WSHDSCQSAWRNSSPRLLRKQLSCWNGTVQVLQETQEDNHCKIEAHIRTLAASSDCLRKELEELRQNVQGILYFSKIKQKNGPSIS
ncbi:unnamed protein product, partial [Staurois parvus]